MTTTQRIDRKERQKLYHKIGKKYIQVNDPYAYDGLRAGWWLVGVQPGCTSVRQCVYPALAELQAAAQAMEDKLVDIIRAASQAKPSKIMLTPEEKKDWDRMIKRHGERWNTMQYPSFHENAAKIVAALTGLNNQDKV